MEMHCYNYDSTKYIFETNKIYKNNLVSCSICNEKVCKDESFFSFKERIRTRLQPKPDWELKRLKQKRQKSSLQSLNDFSISKKYKKKKK
jgi:hypothetical protein